MSADTGGAQVIEVRRGRDGLWRWRYVARRDGRVQVLPSNKAYQSLAEAVEAAGIAYPGVPIDGTAPRRRTGVPRIWVSSVVVALAASGLGVVAALGWATRAAARVGRRAARLRGRRRARVRR
jgi:hypothetical protein